MLQCTIMASLQLVLVFALCSFFRSTWAKATSEGLTIIGGHNVSITEAPYMAALYSKGKFVCGGSIIHDQFVLTSAHCVRDSLEPRIVIIGADRLRADDDRVVIFVKQEFCHEDYPLETKINGICLLKLFTPIPFGPKIAKIDLPRPDIQIPGGLLVNVTGWGITSPSSERLRSAKQLQQVTIATVADSQCLYYYPNLKDTMICAGTKGQEACRGDDGGPLTLHDIQIGVSYEKGCDRVAGVYTKLSAYMHWIKNTIEANL